MNRLIVLSCLSVSLLACQIKAITSKVNEDVEIQLNSFKDRASIFNHFESMWTGIIHKFELERGSKRAILILHDNCSGWYCPTLYVYTQAHSEGNIWRLTYAENLTPYNADMNLKPNKISAYNNTLQLLNHEQEVVKSYAIDSLIVAPSGVNSQNLNESLNN